MDTSIPFSTCCHEAESNSAGAVLPTQGRRTLCKKPAAFLAAVPIRCIAFGLKSNAFMILKGTAWRGLPVAREVAMFLASTLLPPTAEPGAVNGHPRARGARRSAPAPSGGRPAWAADWPFQQGPQRRRPQPQRAWRWTSRALEICLSLSRAPVSGHSSAAPPPYPEPPGSILPHCLS